MDSPDRNGPGRNYIRLSAGLQYKAAEPLFKTTPLQYISGGSPRFDTQNPTIMNIPFWKHMIYTQNRAWSFREYNGYPIQWREDDIYEGPRPQHATVPCPIWCFQRFGQTRTYLDDGRVIYIAGEHEDGYDPDFCIYNDVVVHDTRVPFGPDAITIYGYPREIFPPTDNHTATFYREKSTGKECIVIVGGQGYGREGDPHKDETTVYRLDLRDFSIQQLHITGEKPEKALVYHIANLVEHSRLSDGNEESTQPFIRITTSTWRRNWDLLCAQGEYGYEDDESVVNLGVEDEFVGDGDSEDEDKNELDADSGTKDEAEDKIEYEDENNVGSDVVPEETNDDDFVEEVYHLDLTNFKWIKGELRKVEACDNA